MATYEYRCEKNPEHKYIEIRAMNENQKQLTCTDMDCGGKLLKVFGAPTIIFNGTGFSAKRG